MQLLSPAEGMVDNLRSIQWVRKLLFLLAFLRTPLELVSFLSLIVPTLYQELALVQEFPEHLVVPVLEACTKVLAPLWCKPNPLGCNPKV